MATIFGWFTFLAFFVLLFLLIVILRYISYRETLALAEKGLVRPLKKRDGKDALRWGIIITAFGLAVCVGLWPIGWLPGVDIYPLGFGPWMMVGIIPIFLGLALILIYVLTHERRRSVEPPSPAELRANGEDA
jgi:MFS family permease